MGEAKNIYFTCLKSEINQTVIVDISGDSISITTMGDRACYNCGESGHLSRDCSKPRQGGGGRSMTCYNCNEEGHMSRDCPQGGRGGGGRGNCYNCGQPGHISRDCTEARSGGGGGGRDSIQCYKCSGYGHISRDCTN